MKCWIGQKAWRDPMENRPHAAFGYENVAVFTNKETADAWVKKGGLLPKDWCWALQSEVPRRRLKELPLQ